MRALASVVAMALLASPAAHADSKYGAKARSSHIDKAIDGLRAISKKDLSALRAELLLGGRTDCKSAVAAPRVSCMVKMARNRCAKRVPAARGACNAIADVIVTNRLAETDQVPSKKRLKLMETGDYRKALDRELLDRYAILVARLTLTKRFDPGPGLAGSIDAYCIEHVRTRPMTWARCVSAIVWYIGTAHKTE